MKHRRRTCAEHNALLDRALEESRKTVPPKPLRTCMSCGIKAITKKQLEHFVKAPNMKYERLNKCNTCWAREVREKRERKKENSEDATHNNLISNQSSL